MTVLVRRPDPNAACADPRAVRAYYLFKLLVLLLLLALLAVVGSGVAAPTLEPPPRDVLAGPLLLSGTGTPGSVVELLANGQPLAEVTVRSSGRWDADAMFPAGQYDLQAQARREGGKPVSAAEGRAQVSVVDLPTLEVAATRWDNGAADVSLAGSATPGSRLRLSWNGQTLATLDAPTNGRWGHALASVPAPSENEFIVEVLDRGDRVLGAAAPRQLTLVPRLAARNPLLVDGVSLGRLRRSPLEDTVSGDLLVTGRGEPGALIILEKDGSALAEAAAITPEGTWEAPASLGMPPGKYDFRVRMVDEEGVEIEAAEFDLSLPAPPTVHVGGGPSDADLFELSGTAMPNERLTLYLNDGELVTLAVDGTGGWQHVTHLAAGLHQIVARSGDSLHSDVQEVEVTLARPVILGQNRDERGAPLPGFFGEGRPDTVLEIVAEEVVIGQVEVDGEGRWQCACTLAPGEHTVFVREVVEPERVSDPLALIVNNPVPA